MNIRRRFTFRVKTLPPQCRHSRISFISLFSNTHDHIILRWSVDSAHATNRREEGNFKRRIVFTIHPLGNNGRRVCICRPLCVSGSPENVAEACIEPTGQPEKLTLCKEPRTLVGDSELSRCHLVTKLGPANKRPCQAPADINQITYSGCILSESVKKTLSNITLIPHHNSSAQRFVHLSTSSYEQLHAAMSTDEHRPMWTDCRHM